MAMRSMVAEGLGVSPQSADQGKKIADDMLDILNRMSTYNDVVIGANAQTFPVQSQRIGSTADAIADAERLSALLTTENIQLMKGLGSMSNIEFGNIEKIGSSLVGRDKDGNAFFKGSRSTYDREIQRLKDDIAKVDTNLGSSDASVETDYVKNIVKPTYQIINSTQNNTSAYTSTFK